MPVLAALDQHFEAALKKHAPGKANYHSLVQECEGYPSRIRLKVNATGPTAARLWKPDQTLLGDIRQLSLAGSTIIPCVVFTKAWFMGLSYGVTCELRAAVVYEGVSAASAADVFPL